MSAGHPQDAVGVIAAEPDWSRKGNIMEAIKNELRMFNHGRIMYAPRETNQTAHALAKLALVHDGEHVWTLDHPPTCIQDLITYEQSVMLG
jgi:hypothetical protein